MWTLARASSWSLDYNPHREREREKKKKKRERNERRSELLSRKVLRAGEVQEPADGNQSAALPGFWRAQGPSARKNSLLSLTRNGSVSRML